MYQELKHNLISILYDRYIDKQVVVITRVNNTKVGEKIISNNGFIGILAGAIIVANRILCHVEVHHNGRFLFHHCVDSKDLQC